MASGTSLFWTTSSPPTCREIDLEKTRPTFAEEVRAAGREPIAARKQGDANQKRLEYQRENLKAEVQKFQSGSSTNFLVSEAQNQVSSAESKLYSARIANQKAQVEYHRALGRLPHKRNIHLP